MQSYRIFISTAEKTRLSVRKGRLYINAFLRDVGIFGIQMHKDNDVATGTYIPYPMSKKTLHEVRFLLREISCDVISFTAIDIIF
jgi:hypothetical protein